MASILMADGGLLNGAPLHTRPPETANDLCEHVVTFQKYTDISLLLPFLTKALTKDEIHHLKNDNSPEGQRVYDLITDYLPKKAPSIVHTLKQALVDSLAEDGSSGHRIILQEVFGDTSHKANLTVAKSTTLSMNADVISEESECFIDLLRNFRKELQSGPEEMVSQRLQDVVEYFCHVRRTNGDYYLKENVRAELCSDGLNFVKFFNCLDSKSEPPVISDRDVSMLHKIIKVLSGDKSSKGVVVRLTKLLNDYELNAGIMQIREEPPHTPESASLKVKVTNAHSGSAKLKNGVKNSFWQSLKFKFLGSGSGSVVLYWEFPREYFQQLLGSFEQVYQSETGIQQFRITKVEARHPEQIYLEMEITDPELLQLSQQQHFVADDIDSEQETFILLLIKINQLVGGHVSDFLSSTRDNASRFYSHFEGDTFFGMINKLISENKLHCYDISYLQLFLYSLYKQDTTQGSDNAAFLVALKETQDYESVPTGSPLPSIKFRCRSRPVTIITQVGGVICISYEVMTSLKYGFSQLLNISQLSFHYVSWKAYTDKSFITWHTTEANFDKIESLLCFQDNLSNGFLEVTDDPEINYPYIKFNCEIKNMQILLDGSPLLIPDVENTGDEVTLPLLRRVGHVCATCFVDFNWAFRLLWLHCLKPQEHRFTARVNAVYSIEDSSLYRVRPFSDCIMVHCVQGCTNGRKCPKAHSRIELQYWNKMQQGTMLVKGYKDALGGSVPLKPFSFVKGKFSIKQNPSVGAIASNLTAGNYVRKFHDLLHWEEKQHIEELNKRCVDPVDVVVFHHNNTKARDIMPNLENSLLGYIVMKDADSAKYVIQASQSVRFELTQSCKLVAEVISVPFKKASTTFKMEHVPILLVDRPDDKNVEKFKTYISTIGLSEDVKISNIIAQFQIKHRYFLDLHLAIENIPKAIIHKLFPIGLKKKHQKQALDTKFGSPFTPDPLQLDAITSMLSADSDAPFLLVGPFGTGKTHVLACAAAAIVTEDATAKVLIVTHHNKSADTFVSKYFGTIESTKVLPSRVAPVRLSTEDSSPETDKPYSVKFNDKKITKELLDERRVVITTFLTALRFASTEKLPRGYFTHILIDEGAQTREPETIAPLMFANERTKIIIAGDHLQVGPKTLVLGENAIKHGLAESLVERLHHHYNSNPQWISHLLINYRSHEAIMRLSSNLFYNSSVVSKSTAVLHPSTCYPLHFVCTSLTYGKFQNVIDIDMSEVDVVIKEVKKYTNPWPAQWGSREKSSVCIVASNRNQVIKFHEQLGALHSYVEVLPSFDIQGREFRAVFISTNEATDGIGCSKNPTKSMCDPFVFNTVITRSQSLLVCVGNPYFICQLEENMQTGRRCWATYIQCCLDCETFSSLNTNFGQSEKEALQNALQISRNYSEKQISSGDEIVKGYLKLLAQFEEHKKALRFSKMQGDMQWVNHAESDDSEEDEDDFDSFSGSCIRCVIYFQSRYHAMARQVENHNRIIHVNGQSNLRGAFNESVVLIELVGNHIPSKEAKKEFGRVVQLISLESPLFLCEVDSNNSSRFYPINKKDPIFYNLPFLSKTTNGVAVFDSHSLSEVPRIFQVFPAEIAKKRIFVLQYLCWNSDTHKFPVGVVIDSFPKGYTFSSGEKLLRVQYNFDFCESESNFKLIKQTKQCKPEYVFAITQKVGGVIENAFSLHTVNKGDTEVYYISFYVLNVAKCIEDEELFESVERRGVSACVKTDKLHQWKFYSMFPPKVLNKVNFAMNEPRHCFSVSCQAEVHNGRLTYRPFDNPIKEVMGVLIKTYTADNVESLIENQAEFKEISVLFQVAQCLQYKRLGYYEAAYSCLLDISETPCTQLILKEFSLWANRLVAIQLAESSYLSFPLYCKFPSSEDARKVVCNEHGMALQTSVHNKYFIPNNGLKVLPNVIINGHIFSLLLEALKDNNIFKYLSLLAYDNCFPQFCVAAQKFRNIKQVKEFVACTEDDNVDFNNFSHEAVVYTTMFASPLTSYFDIVVQDMLSSTLNFQPSKYDHAKLRLICEKANRDFRRKLEFEENVFNLQLGVTLKAFNHRIVGYVEKIDDKNRLKLSFPSYELQNLTEHQSSFNVAHLFAVKGSDSLARSSTYSYEWKVKVASFVGPSSIFTSQRAVTLSNNQDTNTTMHITLFLANSSNEDKESHYDIELEKKQLFGNMDPSTVTVSQGEWKQLTSVMLNPTEVCCHNAIKILSYHKKRSVQKQGFTQEADQTVFWSGTVKMQMQGKYDMLHVWFGAAQDTALIYPKIQQVEIAPFLKVCIQHNSEPERCFTDVSLVTASKGYYADINEYQKLWGQVVIAENAVSSVNTRDVLLLENVCLQWPALEYCCDSYIGDYYRIPKDDYIIMKPPLDFNRSSIEMFDLRKGDLLCVQYDVTDKKIDLRMGFVFHMIVHKVEINKMSMTKNSSSGISDISDLESDQCNDDDIESIVADKILAMQHEEVEITYFLKFSEGAAKISEAFRNVLKAYNPSCLVQILHIQPPQRRIYRTLSNLHKSHTLTQSIACGDIAAIQRAKVPRNSFTMEELSAVLDDDIITHLWDKPKKKLSNIQMATLRQACCSPFFIIHGPPGSGKSILGAHLAYTFAKLNQNAKRKGRSVKKRCVVYCGSSNVSVDVVAKMLCDLTQSKTRKQRHRTDTIKVLRIYPRNIEQSVYPSPFELLNDSETSSGSDTPYLKDLMKYSLHYKIRYECGRLGETIRSFEERFAASKQKERLASKADRMKYKQAIDKASNRILSDNIDILICTCNEMGSGRVFHNIEAEQVIIDEAAMVTEPESMIPIQHAKQVILIGDHQQLQPRVNSRHASRNGLSTSLFQRYVDTIKYDHLFLSEQFRMHSYLCKFPAENFYAGKRMFTNSTTAKEMEIKANKLKQLWPNKNPSTPFVFCDVIGTEAVTDTEFVSKTRVGQESKFNNQEADKIVEIAKVLVLNYGVLQQDILALSPYQAQCKHIERKLQQCNLSKVKSSTVKSSEGYECGIVLLSTVRSLPLEDFDSITPDRGWLNEHLGFLTDTHIINVGITRCQYGLIIVGNRCLLEYDGTWSDLISFCSKQRNVVRASQFPSRTDLERIKGFSIA